MTQHDTNAPGVCWRRPHAVYLRTKTTKTMPPCAHTTNTTKKVTTDVFYGFTQLFHRKFYKNFRTKSKLDPTEKNRNF